MARRDIRHSTEQRAYRRRRGRALGVGVPAVVSIGALPAFAVASDDATDDAEQYLETQLESENVDMSVDAVIDADDDISEPGTYEELHDPFEGDEAESTDDQAESTGRPEGAGRPEGVGRRG